MIQTTRIALALLLSVGVDAFYPPIHSPSKTFASCAGSLPKRSHALSLQKGWFDNGDQEGEEDGLVTRDDLNRDLLGMENPKIKRKNRKGRYKPLDNRDHLPFSVRIEDDPYKTRYEREVDRQSEKKIEGTSKKTDLDRQMLAATRRNAKGKKDSATTPSRLVQRRSNKKNKADDESKAMQVLGEFELDKSTTSGDIIVLGDKEFRVETARCQYKYAGGQRFVMVRKILEVKELKRVQNEEVLQRQYDLSSSISSTLYDDPEEAE